MWVYCALFATAILPTLLGKSQSQMQSLTVNEPLGVYVDLCVVNRTVTKTKSLTLYLRQCSCV